MHLIEHIFNYDRNGKFYVCCNMGGLWKYSTNWNKPGSEEQILYDSAYIVTGVLNRDMGHQGVLNRDMGHQGVLNRDMGHQGISGSDIY
jgi:hypothetical protein